VVEEISLPEENAGDDIIAMIQHYSQKNTGIIIQLPLPEKFNAQKILNSIAPEYDPDMLSEASHEQFGRGESRITPPVVGAMKEILRAHAIVLKGKRAVVLGQGILVGKPVKVWLEREGALAHVVDIDTPHEERKKLLKNAGIIVSGAGTPHSICKEDVKEEVVILDAGTSEEGGALKGDVHPDVGEGASLFTPTPGGVGPLTSVMLFKNLIYLTR
jgi:methylenetetrahydrofolate dehydrogenase (NADP+)/methenyltetrahydrofolate cyclohydrolase